MITPCQLSSEAKQLVRNGIPEDQFVNEVKEKGYWDGCKTLDTEADVELHIHLFKHNKETYFTVAKGKHRIPIILAEDDKYALFKFPKGMPIPSDINRECISMKKLPNNTKTNSDNIFD